MRHKELGVAARLGWALLLIIGDASARIHKLEIRNDVRRYIALTTFGFYKGGLLSVDLTNFKAEPSAEDATFGFSLDRTLSDAMNPYLDIHQERCLLRGVSGPRSELDPKDDSYVVYFTMDLKNLTLRVNCSRSVRSIHIYKDSSLRSSPHRRKRTTFTRRKKRRATTPPTVLGTKEGPERTVGDGGAGVAAADVDSCSGHDLPMTVDIIEGREYYNASFSMRVINDREEGLYNLYFHSCRNYPASRIRPVAVDFTMRITEENEGNFLSAGEMPLPALYFTMALLFFLSGCFWVSILKKSQHPVYKIHLLMAVLVYLKSLSLLFHGINYHFIETRGEHVPAWAILYYITHLLKGAVLFITIVLVGTGWDFIKHILADRDKKLFMIVIPLQVLANVAEIIIEESEEGDIEHKTWRDVFILVDLLCCGAILFPVVWSIRHLQESAHTDGKAAVNLRKLKLFRHFYIMIVCYIYFTRIIVYLLKMTVPFQYEWLDEMFREMATYVFFVLTGYKFRPASANPYFTVANEDEIGRGDAAGNDRAGDDQDDDDDDDDDDDENTDMDIVISGSSGLTEGLGKTRATKIVRPSTATEFTVNEEERDSLMGKRESSHQYH